MSDAVAAGTNPGPWLARRYTIALALLASFIVGGELLRQTLEPASDVDKHLSDLAGRQRMFSQRMLALGVLAAESDGPDRVRHLAELTKATQVWDREYQQLVAEGVDGGLLDDRADLARALEFAGSSRRDFSTAVQEIQQGSRALDKLIAAEPKLLAGSETIVAAFRRRAEAHAVVNRQLDEAYVVLVLVGLLLQGVVIFNPALQEIHDSFHRQQTLAAIVESTSDAIVSKTLDGTVLSWNDGAARLYGYSAREVVGRPIFETIPPELHDAERQILAAVGDGESVERYRAKRVRRDGSVVLVDLTASPVRDADGRLTGASTITRDVTAQTAAAERLADSERLLACAAHVAHIGSWEWDVETNALTWSDEQYRMFGLEPNAIDPTFERFLEFVHPDDRQRVMIAAVTAATHNIDYDEEFRVVRQDGSTREFRGTGTITEVLGRQRLIGICQDVTDARMAERREAQHARSTRFRASVGAALAQRGQPLCTTLQEVVEAAVTHLDAALARLWILDATGQVLELRASAGLYTRLDGAHARVPVGRLKIGAIAAEGQPHVTNTLLDDPLLGDPAWARKQGLSAFAGYPLAVQGEVVGVLAMFARAPLPDTALESLASAADFIAQAVDRRRKHEALRRSEEMFRSVVETTTEWIWVMDVNGIQTYTNPAIETILGWTVKEVTGVAVLPLMHPDDAQRIQQHLPALIASKQGWNGLVVRWRHRDGSYRYLESTAVPILTPEGELAGYQGADRDITERVIADRMKSDFTSFVSHQLRTPLSGMRWMLELASGEPDPTRVAGYIGEARESLSRLTDLVNDLLDLSKLEGGRGTTELTDVDLGVVTRDVLNELRGLVDEKQHQLVVGIGERVPAIRADPQLLRQVVLNLVSNAIKYTPTGGRLEVSVQRHYGMVHWVVRDTGIGIPKGAQSRLFEKFYRADNAVVMETEGTGLGLHLVRIIVERFNGRVWCESEEGGGSTFQFTLPVEEPAAA